MSKIKSRFKKVPISPANRQLNALLALGCPSPEQKRQIKLLQKVVKAEGKSVSHQGFFAGGSSSVRMPKEE
jgi:hypothetical protein